MSVSRPRVLRRRRGAATAAVATDLLFGEPPTMIHPTALMGRAIAAARAKIPHGVDDSRAALARGGLLTVAGLGATVLASVLVSSRVASAFDARWRGGALTRVAVEGALLKPALSVRALLSAGRQVERALMDGDLERARQLLSWHLVSRNTTGLSASQVAGAAIASLAENVSDSVVAPLLAYRLGGMPAAYGYRFANTADAMLGYRTPELEWFGKPAARLDDLFNLAPSRATAVLIALVAGVARGSTRESLRVAWDDAGQTPSPNGGWPMAAMAGALGVRLEKRGVYVLGDHLREPRPSDIGRARKLVTVVTALATLAVDLS